ncbi:MAG: PLP-dependent transferase [Eubacteriaceae bacterium]|jgi:arginine/lysine/ornithine decarboxylase|nr:PLP-dependent transferase [Eubacteriaceae bacterium]
MHESLKGRIAHYSASNPARFHVPSHKGRGEGLVSRAFDITELEFSDNINHPNGQWLAEEESLAQEFSVRATLLSLNGSTAAVIAALCACLTSQDKAVIGADSHVSAYYGLMHSGAAFVRARQESPFFGPSLASFREAAEKAPGLRLAFVTSPTYSGLVRDLGEIIQYFHEKGAFVVCDEAHGAHLPFADGYPPSAIALGADIVIHSAYKTVNGPTQAAFLHINTPCIDVEDARRWLRTVQTTSPSYPLALDALDAARELKTAGMAFSNIKKWYNQIAEKFEKRGLFLVNKAEAQKNAGASYDFAKIPIDFSSIGLNAASAAKTLGSEYGIFAEMSDERSALFCAGMNSSEEDFSRLEKAVLSLPSGSFAPRAAVAPPLAESMAPIRSAMQAKWQWMGLERAVGMVCADFAGCYPPASVVLAPGDRISLQAASYLEAAHPASRFGIENEKIKVASI